MPFTVINALQMDAFSACNALTGNVGLDNEIRWVNILELLDDLRYIEEGDFLITTAHDLDFQDTKKQEHLIKFLAGSKLAALAVQTGHYIAQIPPSLIKLAEEHKIPLIEIPHDTSFKSLTKALLGELVRRDHNFQDDESIRKNGGLTVLLKQSRFILQKLLSGESAESLREQLRPLRISFHADFFLVLVCTGPTQTTDRADTLGQDHVEKPLVEQSLFQLLFQHKLPFLVGTREMNPVILIQTLENVEKQTASLVELLLSELSLIYPRLDFMAGMSRCHGRLDEICHALAEARRALEAARLGLTGKGRLFRYSNLGPYRLLLEVENLEALEAAVTDTIGPLIRYDHRCGGALVATLNSYLKYLNISAAAKKLFVHRHTMRYRLRQIEELTGLSLDNMEHTFQLFLALKVYHYLKARELA